MDIKTIPLSSLTADPQATLLECANSGRPVLVELPDHRLVALQPIQGNDTDSLIDELLASNTALQALLAKSKAGPRKPFVRSSAP